MDEVSSWVGNGRIVQVIFTTFDDEYGETGVCLRESARSDARSGSACSLLVSRTKLYPLFDFYLQRI